MGDEYEIVNLADFDVIRSTQFVGDYSRGVRDNSSMVSASKTLMHALVAIWPLHVIGFTLTTATFCRNFTNFLLVCTVC